jgi:hypothetical protein
MYQISFSLKGPDQLALILRVVMMNLCRFQLDPLTVEGDFTVRRPAPWTFFRVKVADATTGTEHPAQQANLDPLRPFELPDSRHYMSAKQTLL